MSLRELRFEVASIPLCDSSRFDIRNTFLKLLAEIVIRDGWFDLFDEKVLTLRRGILPMHHAATGLQGGELLGGQRITAGNVHMRIIYTAIYAVATYGMSRAGRLQSRYSKAPISLSGFMGFQLS